MNGAQPPSPMLQHRYALHPVPINYNDSVIDHIAYRPISQFQAHHHQTSGKTSRMVPYITYNEHPTHDYKGENDLNITLIDGNDIEVDLGLAIRLGSTVSITSIPSHQAHQTVLTLPALAPVMLVHLHQDSWPRQSPGQQAWSNQNCMEELRCLSTWGATEANATILDHICQAIQEDPELRTITYAVISKTAPPWSLEPRILYFDRT